MSVHIPILPEPIVEALLLPFQKGTNGWIVDATFGGGGHTGLVLEALEKDSSLSGRCKVLALDQDGEAVSKGRIRFEREIAKGLLKLEQSRFSQWKSHLPEQAISLMADLGFSSDQIEEGSRGLSFRKEGPLDMRLDPTQGTSALHFLKTSREAEIAEVIFELGEERLSRKIASAIVSARQKGILPETTTGLAGLIERSVPKDYRHGRIHPATRTFQALRIWVNDEMGELDALLASLKGGLAPGGVAAILTFHSLEDRKVKQAFKEKELFTPTTKKPIEASTEEVTRNPRARSAKLRIANRNT
jgi:16S rRNA (cytosine1402-N4)-methyltransferase